MRSNIELRNDVQNAITRVPLLCDAEIGVTVRNAFVTLIGLVDSEEKKILAETAAASVPDVKIVIGKIDVQIESDCRFVDDVHIANEVFDVLSLPERLTDNLIKVKVSKGWVTLDGEVKVQEESISVNQSILHLAGVIGVSNHIRVKSYLTGICENFEIEAALKRNWFMYDNYIQVKVTDHKATLTGKVDSLHQKDQASMIAANEPGVWQVDNELLIDYDLTFS